VPDKSERVASFHRETLKALGELVSACGLKHSSELRPHHFMHRAAPDRTVSFAERYEFLEPGVLLMGGGGKHYRAAWDMARADSFSPEAVRVPRPFRIAEV
jgi:hypothetical protein